MPTTSPDPKVAKAIPPGNGTEVTNICAFCLIFVHMGYDFTDAEK
jgi:hypothetical protein